MQILSTFAALRPHQTLRHSATAVVLLLVLLAAGGVLFKDATRSLAATGTHTYTSFNLHQPQVKAVSGVSGSVVEGSRSRRFNGQLLFAQTDEVIKTQAAPAAAAVALPSTKHVQGPKSSKWAVCTTIFQPSEAVMGVAALEGWMVVVVGDQGSADFNFTSSNLVYLSPSDQQAFLSPLGRLGDLLPWKHFARKNVGYLYAIAHGAEVIWDFDDDNVLKPGVTPAMPAAETIRTLQLANSTSSCQAYNVYRDFLPTAARAGQPDAWPRGFPLDLIRKPCSYTLVPGRVTSIAVVQSLADNDPDVDGIFRLTRGVPFDFEASVRHTIAVPQGTLTPWNAQATLFFQPALWSMLLPVTVHGRVSDIWRSYVAQRLLWDAGYVVAFAPSMVNQFRSPHSYLADMQAELDLYFKSGQLVSFLQTWRGTSDSLAGRCEELMVQLYERGYIEEQDVLLTQHWLLSLQATGYTFPAVTASRSASLRPAASYVTSSLPQIGADQLSGSTTSHKEDALLPETVAYAVNTTAHAPHQGGSAGTSSLWAVFTTNKGVTPVMKEVAAMDGWRVVVVAESLAAEPGKWPNITYLSLQQQDSLGYAILRHLPREGPWRRNVGYMYAIHNGAAAVYDADADSSLLEHNILVTGCTEVGELTSNITAAPCMGPHTVLDVSRAGADQQAGSGPAVLSPYHLFGQPGLWPRGMPTHSSLSTGQMSFSRQPAKPLIQQGMVDGCPDAGVDPHGQGGSGTGVRHNSQIEFDPTAFSVVLPDGVMAPLNRYNTLYFQDALWSLVLPIQDGSLCDITRGYLAQRLLWEIGATTALLPATANCFLERPIRSVRGQQARVDLLVQDMLEVKLVSASFPDRMRELYQHMITRRHLQGADLGLLNAWLTDLQQAGLVLPSPHESPPVTTGPFATGPVASAMQAVQVSHVSSAGHGVATVGGITGTKTVNSTQALYEAITRQATHHTFAFPPRWAMQRDKVLYININRMHGRHDAVYEQTRLLHAVYRPFFRRVVFAGFGATGAQHKDIPGIFHSCDPYTTGANAFHPPGFFAYTCLAGFLASDTWQSLAQGDGVGLLYINDDVVFDPCMVTKLDPGKVWYEPAFVGLSLNHTRPLSEVHGWHWPKKFGPGPTTLQESTGLALRQSYGLMAERVQQRLQQGSHTFPPTQADVYYVPSHLHRRFVDFAHQLHAQWVISEIAVPNIMGLIADEEDGIQDVLTVMVWLAEDRELLMSNMLQGQPHADNILSCEILSKCTGCSADVLQYYGACKQGIFAFHPYKLSNTTAALHWFSQRLTWDCL